MAGFSARAERSQDATQRTELGVAAVEFALVSVFLLTVLSAIIDGGTTLNASRTNTDAVRAAARAGAQPCVGSVGCSGGNATDSDSRILYALAAQLNSQAVNVKKVVIYKASAGSTEPPSACLATSTGVAGVCNVYLDPIGASTLSIPTASPPWPSTARNRSVSSADFLGVYTVVRQANPIGLVVPRTVNLSASAVFRLEPPVLTSSGLPTLPVQPQTPFEWTWSDYSTGSSGGASSGATPGNGAG